MSSLDLWFLPPVLALLAGVLALAPLGAQVLRRGVVFIDLAVAQAAAAAAMAAMAWGDHPAWWVTQAAALAGALGVASLVAWLSAHRPAQREALIGLIYVGCACAALLLAREDSHGAEHLHALLAADVLWADWPQVYILGACALGVALLGQRLGHDRWFFSAFAVVASCAVQALGLFVVFAALIAPGLWQRQGHHPLTAATLATLSALGGLAASWWWDAPSGPLVALGLALCGLGSCCTRPKAPAP